MLWNVDGAGSFNISEIKIRSQLSGAFPNKISLSMEGINISDWSVCLVILRCSIERRTLIH